MMIEYRAIEVVSCWHPFRATRRYARITFILKDYDTSKREGNGWLVMDNQASDFIDYCLDHLITATLIALTDEDAVKLGFK